MNIIIGIIVFLCGISLGAILWFWIDDVIQSRKKPVKNGKVFALKPWSDLKPGLHGGMMVLHTNTSESNPFLTKKDVKNGTDKK